MGRLSEAAWKELENQITAVISDAGYEVNEQNLADARWLIENKLPLTVETFTYKKDLEFIKVSSDKEKLLNKMLTGMKNGINPKDVSLISADFAVGEQVVARINSISDEAITQAVQKNYELTIKNLSAIQDHITERESIAIADKAEVYMPGCRRL